MEDKIKRVIDDIQSRLNNVTVTVQNVIKNNNTQFIGICIKKHNENIAPVIYIDSFLEAGMSVEEISNLVMDIYRKNSTTNLKCVENVIGNFEEIKTKIFARVVNYDSNKEMLENIPHERFLNLTLYPVILLNMGGDSDASIKVTHDIVKRWNVNSEDVINISKYNTITYEETNILTLKDILTYYTGNISEIDEIDESIYVITNNKRCYGANRVIDIPAFDKLAEELDSDLVVIPSSVHELIVASTKSGINNNLINEMIQQINDTAVSEEEILSNCAYIFIKKHHSFEML